MSPDVVTNGTGRLVLVVGPSGAGKDTLMRLAARSLAGRAEVLFARRLVTRPQGAFEDHDTIDQASFEEGVARGRFPLAWRAHGLGYALPASVADALAHGVTVVANVSRGVVDEARQRFPRVDVVLITAPVEELERRVAARGREADVAQRVSRAAPPADVLAPELVVENIGDPTAGAAALTDFLARTASAPAQ